MNAIEKLDDLYGLVKQIDEQHRLIQAPGKSMVSHAIRCGELLIQAQRLVPEGGWTSWIENNLEAPGIMYRTTAYGYMRLARHKKEVLESGVTGIDPALEMLTRGKTLTDSDVQAIKRLAKSGVSQVKLAEQFGVRKSTISYRLNQKSVNRRKRLQRHERRRALTALQREEQRREMVTAGGRISRAYAEIRKAELEVSHKLEEKYLEIHKRAALQEALNKMYQIEDLLGAAIRPKR